VRNRFAYVEFVDKESVENALKLDDSTFKGRQLKVGLDLLVLL
jgi:RNA recognition motif-containing protein